MNGFEKIASSLKFKLPAASHNSSSLVLIRESGHYCVLPHMLQDLRTVRQRVADICLALDFVEA